MSSRPVLRVGCPMWAHRPWAGRFYPVTMPRGRELEHYVTWCNAVEGNTTFYAQPAAGTVARWAELSPDTFRFAFKLPRTITHDRRLRDVTDEMRGFLAAVEPLGPRVGPIQVQLPATFGPDSLEVLVNFLRRLPTERQWALELRHRAFFDGGHAHRAIDEFCLDHGIGRVVLDTTPLYAVEATSAAAVEERRSKPRLPVVLDAVGPSPIVRVIGEDSPAGTLDGLLAWAPRVVSWLHEGRCPFVFVHQPENLDSPGLARAFHEHVATLVPGLEPLADPLGPSTLF